MTDVPTVHVAPKDGRHRCEADGWCWCQPKCVHVALFGRLIVHKQRHD